MSHGSSNTKYRDNETRQEHLHPAFTNGPARFIVANDGSKDCLALLVTGTFIEQLNNMFEQDRHLDVVSGPFSHAKLDTKSIEDAILAATRSFEGAKSENEKNEILEYLEHQEPRLRRLRQRRDELDKQCGELRGEIEGSSNYAHYVLETAMRERGLLRQQRPIDPPRSRSEKSLDHSRQQQVLPEDHARAEPDPEELERQAAYDELRSRWYHLGNIQRRFDEREYLYNEEVVEYLRGCNDGDYDFPRSELDRRHLVYGQRLTGALIDAESSYERAKAYADALGAGSTHSDSIIDYQIKQQTNEQVTSYTPCVNRSLIEAWRAGISAFDTQDDMDMEFQDAADAGLVQISDSTSAVDFGEYRRKIDRWQVAHGLHEGADRRQTKDLWMKDDGALDRRHSSQEPSLVSNFAHTLDKS